MRYMLSGGLIAQKSLYGSCPDKNQLGGLNVHCLIPVEDVLYQGTFPQQLGAEIEQDRDGNEAEQQRGLTNRASTRQFTPF